ncbi:hypothetical protein M378DRAFT_465917 [Amanita muscaria Koide BX008]|uniref:Uncharacterized protein n=1 Tax=Amanita muscaria (strain Koide BX008) TaxID=946122 RepID=A0A0C2S1M8_AMAMK|nr:hypothetical protein M378DRAFT_465917 [Amanita muscaria Koide BX008]
MVRELCFFWHASDDMSHNLGDAIHEGLTRCQRKKVRIYIVLIAGVLVRGEFGPTYGTIISRRIINQFGTPFQCVVSFLPLPTSSFLSADPRHRPSPGNDIQIAARTSDGTWESSDTPFNPSVNQKRTTRVCGCGCVRCSATSVETIAQASQRRTNAPMTIPSPCSHYQFFLPLYLDKVCSLDEVHIIGLVLRLLLYA